MYRGDVFRMTRLKKFVAEENSPPYKIPMINREVNRKINPKTNREKNFKKTMYHETDIAPKDRTFKNLPRYANDKSKVRFQDWLLIKPEKRSPEHDVASFGKSEADGKYYGWSHRAVYGFGVGDTIKDGTAGLEYTNRKPPFTLKNDSEAREMAVNFSRAVS